MTVQVSLDQWKHQLLDLSRRNRLLYFQESKRQTLKVSAPGSDDLFDRIVFQERPCTVVGLDQQAVLWGEDLPKNEAGAADSLKRAPKANEIVFEGAATTVSTALYTLRSRARTEVEERGVSALYMAFGFLHWFESDSSDHEVLSPLVLVPVDLQRDTAIAPYRIAPRDDEVVLNPTLEKALNEQFGIHLPDIPEADFCLTDYIAGVRRAVENKTTWSVDDATYMGLFSFLKLGMYRDLENGLDAAEKSPVICRLAGVPLSADPSPIDVRPIDPKELDEQLDPAECLSVLDADSSQQQAIELAKAGSSFVLQGPPGTGKSQTIANMVAELVGQGRTVLFVSEKVAALDVVYQRLAKAGLADACLALHSHKANKREVVAELARTYELGATRPIDTPPFNYERLRQRKAALNQYVRELHALRGPLGTTVFRALGKVSSLIHAPMVPFDIGDAANLTASRFEKMLDAVAKLSGNSDAVNSLDSNPWRGSIVDGQSIEVRRRIADDLNQAHRVVTDANDIGVALAETLGLGPADLTTERVGWMLRIALALVSRPNLLGCWLNSRTIPDVIELADSAHEHHRAADSESKTVGAFFDSLLDYDLDGLAARLKGRYSSLFARMRRDYREEALRLSAFTKSGRRPTFGQLRRIIPVAVSLRDHRTWIAAHSEALDAHLGSWYAGFATDWPSLQAAIVSAKELLALLGEDPPESLNDRIGALLSDRESLRSIAQRAASAIRDVRLWMHTVGSWFGPDAPMAGALVSHEFARFADTLEHLTALRERIDDMEAWTRLSHAVQTCIESGMTDPTNLLLTAQLASDQYRPVIERRVFTLWLDHWVSCIPVLREFEVASHLHLVEEFCRLDEDLQGAAKNLLLTRISARRPDPYGATLNLASSQPAILMREAKKKRRHKPLRRLFAEIPDLLVSVKPCIMMSPLSVSQFLPLGTILFDTVIFDEASQIKPEDAIGSIMRGRQTIIVGDDKQLPPTSFFDVSTPDDVDEDEASYDGEGDYESILDRCVGANMQQPMLHWHYRSRREGLIAFSNRHFYKNDLVTFPSPDFQGTGTGVEFRYLADGVYDRSGSRTNLREVAEVVDIVRRHARECPEKTLGVVAFSQAQRVAIDHALWRLRSQEPDIEPFLSEGAAEPFFVKNLENVQGDERDVIVFSVGYGHDAAGKLTMNFGPINIGGGERRLNVAITRARERVILVSSIRGSDIDMSRTQAKGVHLLKGYLEYAERGVSALESDSRPLDNCDPDSDFERQVASVIRSWGYHVDTQVGCSGYRIDLAVVHPTHPGRYVIGIECDGASYHSAATARERDRLRAQVLANLGWRLFRVWSTDWFRAQVRQARKLKQAIEEALAVADNEPVVTHVLTSTPDGVPVSGCAVTRTEAAAASMRVFQSTEQALPQISVDRHASSHPKSSEFTRTRLPSAEPDKLHGVPYTEYRPPRQRSDFYSSEAAVGRLLVAVVKAEGPIHFDLATRRVASAWGFARVGQRIQGIVMRAAARALKAGTITVRGEFFYPVGGYTVHVRTNVPGGPSRKAMEIAPEEYAEAARTILCDLLRLSRDDLIVATARQFGFDRTGTDVRAAISLGIDHLVESGEAAELGGDMAIARRP